MIKANVYVEYELIGHLSFDGEFYYFSYSEDFKNGLTKWNKTFVELNDVNRTYKSKELWIVFKMRLPSNSRKDFKEFLKRNNVDIDCDDLTKLILTKGKLATDFISIVEDKH